MVPFETENSYSVLCNNFLTEKSKKIQEIIDSLCIKNESTPKILEISELSKNVGESSMGINRSFEGIVQFLSENRSVFFGEISEKLESALAHVAVQKEEILTYNNSFNRQGEKWLYFLAKKWPKSHYALDPKFKTIVEHLFWILTYKYVIPGDMFREVLKVLIFLGDWKHLPVLEIS